MLWKCCTQYTSKSGKLSNCHRTGKAQFSLPSQRKAMQRMFKLLLNCTQFSSIQSLSHVRIFETPWTAACQTSLSIINSWSLLKLMSIELVMPSNDLILCRPLLLQPSIFPNIRVFSNESAVHIRWPKYWSFCFNISPPNEYSRLISFRMDWLDLLADFTC